MEWVSIQEDRTGSKDNQAELGDQTHLPEAASSFLGPILTSLWRSIPALG